LGYNEIMSSKVRLEELLKIMELRLTIYLWKMKTKH